MYVFVYLYVYVCEGLYVLLYVRVYVYRYEFSRFLIIYAGFWFMCDVGLVFVFG